MNIVDQGKTVSVDGQVFAKLSPNDRRGLLAPIKAARRVNLREDLREAVAMSSPKLTPNITDEQRGAMRLVGPEDFLNEIDAFDQMVFGDNEFFEFLCSIEGRGAIIDRACRKANPDENAAAAILDGLAMSLDEDFKFAALLAGVELLSPAQAAQQGTTAEPENRPSVAGS